MVEPHQPTGAKDFCKPVSKWAKQNYKEKSILNYGAVGFILILSILFNKKGKYKTHRINNEMQID